MRTISLTININSKTLILLVSILVAVIGGKNIRDSYAQTTANPFTGSCGLIQNYNHFGWNTALSGSSGNGSNGLLYINFDTKTVSGITNNINNFNLSNTSESQDIVQTIPFSIKNGPIATTFTLSIKTVSGTFSLHIMPVNGGQTFLVISGDTSTPNTGICQKI